MSEALLALGVLSSVAAELVVWINKKLSGTVLKGDGAFLLASAVSLVIALGEVIHSGVSLTSLSNYNTLWVTFAQVWAVSQVVFLGVIQTLGLDVSSTNTATQTS